MIDYMIIPDLNQTMIVFTGIPLLKKINGTAQQSVQAKFF